MFESLFGKGASGPEKAVDVVKEAAHQATDQLASSPVVEASKDVAHSTAEAAVSFLDQSKYVWSNWRSLKLDDLPVPGPAEQLHKEARGVFLNNLLFDGAKVDVTRGLSPNFMLTHALTFGSTTVPPSYNFITAFMQGQSFVNGNIDTEGNLMTRAHVQVNDHITTKIVGQLTKQAATSALSVETDYIGKGYCATLKLMNPNPIAMGTGTYSLAYLQSVTPGLSVGGEFSLNKLSASFEEAHQQLFARWALTKSDIVTCTLDPAGMLLASYFRKLSDKMEVAADVQMSSAQGKQEAVAQVATKLEFRSGSTLRMQMDSSLRIMSVLEERISPNIGLLFSADLDHMKNQHKVGFGLAFES